MDIFQRIETLVPFQLQQIVSAVEIDLVFAQHHHGTQGFEGKLPVIHGDPVAVKPYQSLFLQQFLVLIHMDLTQLHAVVADEKVAEALEVAKNTPLLNMEEIDYDIDGNIIFYSSQYFVDDIFEQTVLRKKL